MFCAGAGVGQGGSRANLMQREASSGAGGPLHMHAENRFKSCIVGRGYCMRPYDHVR
jgi:hypothetical protein